MKVSRHKACDECRRQHLKCEGGSREQLSGVASNPCDRCSELGRRCIFSERKQQGRPRKISNGIIFVTENPGEKKVTKPKKVKSIRPQPSKYFSGDEVERVFGQFLSNFGSLETHPLVKEEEKVEEETLTQLIKEKFTDIWDLEKEMEKVQGVFINYFEE